MGFDIESLLKSGLLKRMPKSMQKARESITAAEEWMNEAINNLESNSFRSCVLSSYLAMFHSARSLLFAEGFREKSHFAVARFLEDKYVKTALLEDNWVKLLDHNRETRHEDQYSTSFIIDKQEAGKALETAKQFLQRMKQLLEKLEANNV